MKNIVLKKGEPEPAWAEPYCSVLLQNKEVYHFIPVGQYEDIICGVSGSYYMFPIFNEERDKKLCAKCRAEALRLAAAKGEL